MFIVKNRACCGQSSLLPTTDIQPQLIVLSKQHQIRQTLNQPTQATILIYYNWLLYYTYNMSLSCYVLIRFGCQKCAIVFGSLLFHSTYPNMNNQSHFKQIINFKYEIQSTNEIYDHTFIHTTTHPIITTPHLNNTYHHITLHKHTSFHIQDQPPREDVTTNSKSGLARIAPLLIEYAKTIKIQEQVKNEERMEQNTPKLQDKFNTPRKNRASQSKQMLSATPKKKQLLDSPQSKNNYNRKGLALISALIQEVLLTNYANAKRFTCAEISNCILDEFCRRAVLQNNLDSIDQKQKKTIKRRVYDSTNVLIALGKIKKDLKWMYVEPEEGTIGQEILTTKKQTVNNMVKELAHKQELLSNAKRQYEKLRQLKQRNQNMIQSKELTAEATVSTHQGHTTFRFPLLLVSTDAKSELKIELEQNQRNKQQVIVCGEPLYVMSELTALDLINFQAERNHCNSPPLRFQ